MAEQKEVFMPWDDAELGQPQSSLQYHNQLSIAADVVCKHLGGADLAIVLGSGLSKFARFLKNAKSLAYSKIPFMPQTHVAGHDGKLVVGELESDTGPIRVMCFAGRVHAYEGWRPYQTNFAARMASLVGVRLFILTNSAGCGNKNLGPGSIMLIRDHFRATYVDPVGDVTHDARFGPHVLSTSKLYSERMRAIAHKASKATGVKIFEGVYSWQPGPTYETPSEVQAGIKLGVGSFGMSTVPEVLAANAMGMEVFAISLATNMAAGLSDEKLTHDDVRKVALESGPMFEKLLLSIVSMSDVKNSYGGKLPSANAPQVALPLAPAPAWRPTVHQVLEDARIVQLANKEQSAPQAAVFLPFAHSVDQIDDVSALVAGLSSVRSLCLSDLPNFSSHARSASAARGSLLLGSTASGKRVIVISQSEVEGFSKYEANFLAQVLSAVGVRSMLGVLVACPHSKEDTEVKVDETSVAIITDTVDHTKGFVPPPVSPALGKAKLGGHRYDAALGQAAASVLAAEKASVFKASSVYNAFSGPSTPSPFERNMTLVAPQPKTTLLGLSNTTHLDVGRALGMTTFACAIVVPDFVDEASVRAASVARHDLVDNVLLKVLDHANVGAPVVPEVDPAAQDVTVSVRGPAADDAGQQQYDLVEAAAKFVKDKLGAPLCAIMVEGPFTSLLDKCEVVAELKGSDIPHWTDGGVGGPFTSSWTLATVKYNGSEVLRISNPTQSSTSGRRQFDCMGFATRMLQVMGVRVLLLTADLTSCSSGIAAGDIVLVEDHVNITGVNPLYGLNEDRWGARFPDSSDSYPKALREATLAALGGSLAVKQSIVGHVADAAVDSPSEALFLAAQGVSTAAAGVVPQVIRAKHGGVAAGVVGLVTRSLAGVSAGQALPAPIVIDKDALDRVDKALTASVSAANKVYA